MAVTDAAIIARAFERWSEVATARDVYDADNGAGAYAALLGYWTTWARQMAREAVFGDAWLDALADLVAHAAYRTDPGGLLGSGGFSGGAGAAVSVRTRDLSVTYGAGGGMAAPTAATAQDAELATTRPGMSYLAMRDTRALVAAPFVAV